MKNPLYGFIAFLLVQGLISVGFISHEQSLEAQAQLEEVVFYLVLLVTGLLGFHKYVEAHKHQVTKHTEAQITKPVVEEIVKKIDPALPVFTDEAGTGVPSTGTSTDVQILSTSPTETR